MTVKEIEEKMKKRNLLLEKARLGEKPICPKCKCGHVLCKGKLFFYCDNPECDMAISIDPVRE